MTETLNNDENVIFDSASFDRSDWQIIRHKKKKNLFPTVSLPLVIINSLKYTLLQIRSAERHGRLCRQKNIHTLTEGTFVLDPHPLESLFQGVFVKPPSLKPMNFNYFFSVKNVLEESLLIQHDHIILNTAIYCATKQPIDNQTFIHEPTTIVI